MKVKLLSCLCLVWSVTSCATKDAQRADSTGELGTSGGSSAVPFRMISAPQTERHGSCRFPSRPVMTGRSVRWNPVNWLAPTASMQCISSYNSPLMSIW